MKLLIAADICVTKSNASLFASADIDSLVGTGLKQKLSDSDFRIFNLEGPLTESDVPIVKCGPNLRMPPSAIKGIAVLNPSLLTLANNHITDYGKAGYDETLALLAQYDIPFVGTGNSLADVKKSYMLEKDGIKIGVYACAEHEFTIAQHDYPGANPYDPLTTFDDIAELKQNCDYIIVLYHGGKEYYRYPSPDLQRRFRKMADKGADFVVAQHTHCIGCEEKYNGATLLYGQGNFIFDGGDNEFWNSGMLAEIEIHKREGSRITYIPYKKQKGGGIRICSSGEREAILSAFHFRSLEIQDEEFIKDTFLNFSESLFPMHMSAFHGNDFVYKCMKKMFGFNFVKRLYYKPAVFNRIQNYIECEAHREMVLVMLKRHK